MPPAGSQKRRRLPSRISRSQVVFLARRAASPTVPGVVSSPPQTSSEAPSLPVWKPVVLAAMAGGLGWGIRGQYGHETGAMVAGLLVGVVLVLLFRPQAAAPPALRAAAWCTLAMGFGGSMTYGQTVGLTHNPAMIGNWVALRWGLLGLAIKGGLWIGFAGAFLGMGLGRVRYRTREIALLLLGLLALCAAGLWTFNRPFDPAQRILPPIYFSADWRWEPGVALKPRREVWGAYLVAFSGLLAYTGGFRRDRLALNLGLWGLIGGAVGFPLGQSLQAWHAWNLDLFRTGTWAGIAPVINWWNWMETTFGSVMGAALGLGLWLNRGRLAPDTVEHPDPLPPPVEATLLGVHLVLLAMVEFFSLPWIDRVYDFGLLLGFLPVVAVTAGRWAPVLVLLPITVLPIAGKTLNALVYQQPTLPIIAGWLLYGLLPLALTVVASIRWGRRALAGAPATTVLAPLLLLVTWLYWGMNFAFFRFPWPWETWTARTPNGLAFTVCAIGLTIAACRRTRSPV